MTKAARESLTAFVLLHVFVKTALLQFLKVLYILIKNANFYYEK